MIEVWGRKTSSNVQALMWCSREATRQAKRKARDARVFALKPLLGAFGYVDIFPFI